MHNHQLLELLEDFRPRDVESIRRARRPARGKMLLEITTYDKGRQDYISLTDFWLHAVRHFITDSGSKEEFFEGVAYQANFESLSAAEFEGEFRKVQDELTLPPPGIVELQNAYRVLRGRVVGYAGITTDGEYWSGTFGPSFHD